MGSNVLGTPITDETLTTMPEYNYKGKTGTFTKSDKARAALLLKNAQGKDARARTFVENLREKHADDGTLCLVYNATGDDVTLETVRDWSGKVGKSPYPTIIGNGQWGAFLHGHFGTLSCTGAVVYGGLNAAGKERQWVVAWKQSNGQPSLCYTEVRKGNYYSSGSSQGLWDHLLVSLNQGDLLSQAQDYGCKAFASIGNTNSPVLEGILTLEEPLEV